ncbi:MAG: type II and III secretion system protein, partial [Candidatus Omnitrophota bacterium]
ESNSDTNLLSNPKVLAMDDEEAKIVVGLNYPLPTYERNAATGGMEITGYTSQDVGIVLTVRPKIHPDGYVTLNLHPEVSEIQAFTGPEEDRRPIVSTNEVETTLRVKDGETIVIGGMIKDKEIVNVNKLPFLGDLPLVGYAFKHTNRTKEKVETLIFLTVKIIKDT